MPDRYRKSPFERDPQLVRKDVLDGYVSREAAKELYAVTLNGEDLQVDIDATAKRRQTLAR